MNEYIQIAWNDDCGVQLTPALEQFLLDMQEAINKDVETLLRLDGAEISVASRLVH